MKFRQCLHIAFRYNISCDKNKILETPDRLVGNPEISEGCLSDPTLSATCVYYRWVIRRVKIVPTASPSSLGTNLGVHSKSPGYCLGTKFFVSQLLGHSLSLVRKWDKSCMNTVINLITLITLRWRAKDKVDFQMKLEGWKGLGKCTSGSQTLGLKNFRPSPICGA